MIHMPSSVTPNCSKEQCCKKLLVCPSLSLIFHTCPSPSLLPPPPSLPVVKQAVASIKMDKRCAGDAALSPPPPPPPLAPDAASSLQRIHAALVASIHSGMGEEAVRRRGQGVGGGVSHFLHRWWFLRWWFPASVIPFTALRLEAGPAPTPADQCWREYLSLPITCDAMIDITWSEYRVSITC